jgi:hypothetical protein
MSATDRDPGSAVQEPTAADANTIAFAKAYTQWLDARARSEEVLEARPRGGDAAASLLPGGAAVVGKGFSENLLCSPTLARGPPA